MADRKRAVRVELEPAVLEALEADAEARCTTAPQLIGMLVRGHVERLSADACACGLDLRSAPCGEDDCPHGSASC